MPCDFPPGTVEKLNELAARYECGEELWHNEDASLHPLDQTELGIGEDV